jgi:DtxR family Mn-dependent transcriptional regulator
MGYTAAEAHEHADELGDTFTDDMIGRVQQRLGNPDRCPHGLPVDTDVEQSENRLLEPLAALAPGARATVVRLAEHDGELLHRFYDEGLVPGTEIEVAGSENGSVTVRVDGGERRLAPKAAAGLFVKPA